MAGPPAAVSFDDARLALRQVKSHHAFYRALEGGSPGARLVQLAGVEALMVPACPWLSFLNCTFFYESTTALAEAIPELEAEYARAGVTTWRVPVPAHDVAAAAALRRAGLVRTGAEVRQAAVLATVDAEPRRSLDLVPEPTWEMVARCNDWAYGAPARLTMAAAFATMDDPASRLYAAREDGHVVAGLVAREEQGHCYMNLLATVPEARGRGIGAELFRLARRSARDRGCETSSGEARPGPDRLYRRFGARTLSAWHVWERRVATPGHR